METKGGFRALEYDAYATFESSLSDNGTVRWSRHQLDRLDRSTNVSKAYLTVSFPEVDRPLLQSIYGWGALQFQAWARGILTLEAWHSESLIIHTDNILEFWVDGKSYFGGDFYSYRRAPLVLNLQPGQHRLDVRLIRDVRAMGGIGEPDIQVSVEAHVTKGGLTAVEDQFLFPDLIDGELASNLASVPIRNEGSQWLYVLNLESIDVCISDIQEPDRLLMVLWRVISWFPCLSRAHSVLQLGKPGHWLSTSRYFIRRRRFFPLELNMPLATFMVNV